MENKIYGRVYLITNLINGKQYVGKTTRTIKIRFSNHCVSKNQVISKAIKKYGKENFIVQELAVSYSKKELKFLEGLYISWFETLVPNGYNIMKISGDFEKHSEETKEKIRTSSRKPERLKQSSQMGKDRRGKHNKNSRSKYCGVYVKNNKYISETFFNNRKRYIGSYNIETDAAKAYDIAAIKFFGHNCILNFPELRQSYIDGKIIVNKNTPQDNSKSGEKGIYFHNKTNTWQFRWFDKDLSKIRCKYFKELKEAIGYKNSLC